MEQRILEVSRRLVVGGAVTGWAALRLHGGGFFDGVGGDGRTPLDVPLVLPPGRDIRRGRGFRVRRERLPDADLTSAYGVPCTTALRAVLDEAREQRDVRGVVVVLDLALAAGLVTVADLAAFLDERSGWPGVRRAVAASRLADPGSMSPQETRMRLLWILDAGLPRPRCNVDVADLDGTVVGRPDLLSDELGVVGEYDGAFHRGRDRHRADARREDLFRRCGLETFALVAGDLDDVPLAVGRMRAAVARAAAAGLPRAWMTRR